MRHGARWFTIEGMRGIAAIALFATGCSFAGVRGPSSRVDPLPLDRPRVSCTESALLPSLDALGGAAALAAAAGGVLFENVSESGEPENFTRYYAGPLLGAALVYFVSAGFGNRRITWCSDANERLAEQREAVRPVEVEEPAVPDSEP